MKKLLSLILAVVIFASCFAMFATVSQAATTYPSISANSIRSVNIKKAGDAIIFKFVPSESGNYVFASVSKDDTDCTIYNSSWKEIEYDYGSININGNFSVICKMSAGNAYYLKAQYDFAVSDYKTGSFAVLLAKSNGCKHELYTKSLSKATKNSDGSFKIYCEECSAQFSRTIYRPLRANFSASSYQYTGAAIKPRPGVKDAGGYAIAASDFACSYGKNVNAGTGVVKVIFNSMWYDSSCAITKKFKITPKKLTKCGLRAVHTYSGKAIVPTPYYYKTVKAWDDYEEEYYTYKKMVAFKKNVDYTIKVSGGHKQVGTYTAVIKFKGNYKGTVKKTFQIRPKAVGTIKSVPYSATSVKFAWSKVKNISGYRVDRYNYKTKKWKKYKFTTGNSLIIPRSTAKDVDVGIRVFTYKKVKGKIYYNDGSRTPYYWGYTKPNKPVIKLSHGDYFGDFTIKMNREAFHQIQVSDNNKFVSNGVHWAKTFEEFGNKKELNGASAQRYYVRVREYIYNDKGNLVMGPWSDTKAIVTN